VFRCFSLNLAILTVVRVIPSSLEATFRETPGFSRKYCKTRCWE
jgi:hypothetical protein